MCSNLRLKEIFPSAPMICWTRPKNLRDYLIKANLTKENANRRSSRNKSGFKHCNRTTCNMCNFSPNNVTSITCSKTNEKFDFQSIMDCTSTNVIYCITCNKDSGPCSNFKPQYIGETSRMVSRRFNEHFSSIKPDSSKAVGKHFSENGHKAKDLSIIPIERILSKDPWIRIAREKHFIKKFDASLNVKLN